MPMQGALSHDDLFKDLLHVWEQIDPSKTPTEVGTAIRDEAIAFVKKGFDEGKWRVWADCHKLIEEHEGIEEKAPDGMEAFCSVGYDEGEDE